MKLGGGWCNVNIHKNIRYCNTVVYQENYLKVHNDFLITIVTIYRAAKPSRLFWVEYFLMTFTEVGHVRRPLLEKRGGNISYMCRQNFISFWSAFQAPTTELWASVICLMFSAICIQPRNYTLKFLLLLGFYFSFLDNCCNVDIIRSLSSSVPSTSDCRYEGLRFESHQKFFMWPLDVCLYISHVCLLVLYNGLWLMSGLN